MEKDTVYKVMSTKECISYIENAGLTIHDDDTDFSIKSQSGVVYSLPNGEIVLMPTNFDLKYPGIIFKNKGVFEHYAKQDFFPIGEEKMTWLERNNNSMKSFETNHEFFSKTLTEELHLKFPFQNIDDVKTAFMKVKAIADLKEQGKTNDIEALVYSFGLALVCYLKDYQNFKLLMINEYENYNPYVYPMMIKDGERINVLSKVIRYINSQSAHSFENLAISMRIELK